MKTLFAPSNRLALPLIVVGALCATASACGSSNNNSTNNSDSNNTMTATTPQCTLAGGKQYVQSTAVVNQNSCSHLMFAKYSAVFSAVNSNIVNSAADMNKVSSLGDSFQTQIVQQGNARITSFTNNLAAFLITAYGKTSDAGYTAYAGPTMPKAHGSLNITTAQYEAFLTEVVVPSLSAADQNDVTNCFAPVLTDPNFMVQVIACQ